MNLPMVKLLLAFPRRKPLSSMPGANAREFASGSAASAGTRQWRSECSSSAASTRAARRTYGAKNGQALVIVLELKEVSDDSSAVTTASAAFHQHQVSKSDRRSSSTSSTLYVHVRVRSLVDFATAAPRRAASA